MIRFRKWILLLLTAVLLISLLTACQSQQTISQVSSFEPLSEEKISEIITVWESRATSTASKNLCKEWDLTSENFYYGTYGDCIAIFHMGPLNAEITTPGCIQIEELLISSPRMASFYIYRNGEFVDIRHAYSYGWISKEQVKRIQDHHKTTTNDSGPPYEWPAKCDKNRR